MLCRRSYRTPAGAAGPSLRTSRAKRLRLRVAACEFLSRLRDEISADYHAPRFARGGSFFRAADQTLAQIADQELPSLLTIYKDVHSHPELSTQEKRTSELVAKELKGRRLRGDRPPRQV